MHPVEVGSMLVVAIAVGPGVVVGGDGAVAEPGLGGGGAVERC